PDVVPGDGTILHASARDISRSLEFIRDQQCAVGSFHTGSVDSGARACAGFWMDWQFHTGYRLLLNTKSTAWFGLVLLGRLAGMELLDSRCRTALVDGRVSLAVESIAPALGYAGASGGAAFSCAIVSGTSYAKQIERRHRAMGIAGDCWNCRASY